MTADKKRISLRNIQYVESDGSQLTYCDIRQLLPCPPSHGIDGRLTDVTNGQSDKELWNNITNGFTISSNSETLFIRSSFRNKTFKPNIFF